MDPLIDDITSMLCLCTHWLRPWQYSVTSIVAKRQSQSQRQRQRQRQEARGSRQQAEDSVSALTLQTEGIFDFGRAARPLQSADHRASSIPELS